MHELVERGHIFIAQPPLYKVKKGKQERYVKDDAELNAYLLQVALENTRLFVTAGAPALTGPGLEDLAQQYTAVMGSIQRLSRRYPLDVLKKIITMPGLDDAMLLDISVMQNWFAELEQRLNNDEQISSQYEIEVKPRTEEAKWSAGIIVSRHGISSDYSLNPEFFESGEYNSMRSLGEKIGDLIGEGAYVQRGDRKLDVASFAQVMSWLMEEAARGQNIQRYKGLGEMNPEQLSETTLEPETRRLLQVQIEDAIAADEIFTTLMGDQVEPRRDFIEQNALLAANLDV